MNTRPSENLLTILIFGLVVSSQWYISSGYLGNAPPMRKCLYVLEDNVLTARSLVEKLDELLGLGLVYWVEVRTDETHVVPALCPRAYCDTGVRQFTVPRDDRVVSNEHDFSWLRPNVPELTATSQ